MISNFFRKRILFPCKGTTRHDVPLEEVTRRLRKREKVGGAPASPDKFKTVSMLGAINRRGRGSLFADEASRIGNVTERGNGDKESGKKEKYKIPSIRESTVANTISLFRLVALRIRRGVQWHRVKVCMMQKEKKKSMR